MPNHLAYMYVEIVAVPYIQRCHELGINGRVRGGGISNTDARMCFSSFYCKEPAAARRTGDQKYSPMLRSSLSRFLHVSVHWFHSWAPCLLLMSTDIVG